MLRSGPIALAAIALLMWMPRCMLAQTAGAPDHDIYVNPETGDDRSSGLAPEKKGADGPVKTIHRAIRMAKPGDTVHLARLAMPYHETPVFHNVPQQPD